MSGAGNHRLKAVADEAAGSRQIPKPLSRAWRAAFGDRILRAQAYQGMPLPVLIVTPEFTMILKGLLAQQGFNFDGALNGAVKGAIIGALVGAVVWGVVQVGKRLRK